MGFFSLLHKWVLPKSLCSNCGSQEWKRAMWKEGAVRPEYCDTCPGKDGENFRALDGTMAEMDSEH